MAETSQAQAEQAAMVKHPLECQWSMWFDAGTVPSKRSGPVDWSANLKKIVDLDSVEDFWGMHNNMVPASKLALGSNYHLFKHPIEPKWEDPRNNKGGKWVLSLPKRGHDLDKLWLYAVLACIGEQFKDYSDHICGIVVSPRKQADRISLWTRDCNDVDAVRAIGQMLRMELELPDTVKIVYQHHQESLQKQSSYNATNHMEL